MAKPFSISRDTGSIKIGDDIELRPNQARSIIEPEVAARLLKVKDHTNGYVWLDLSDLTFGGQTAALSLCFYNDQFEQAAWSVKLPDAPTEGQWPTREAIDAEISFVSDVLVKRMGIPLGKTPWGEIWCGFDAKGFIASNGLRYQSKG